MFGKRRMTRARWNNVLAPVLLPLVSAPLGPMTYCMITAKKKLDAAVKHLVRFRGYATVPKRVIWRCQTPPKIANDQWV
jgi:hypothetical protein